MGNTWIEKKLIEAAVGLQKGESLSQALSVRESFIRYFFPWWAGGRRVRINLEAVLKQAGNLL